MEVLDPLNPITHRDNLAEECQKAIQVYDNWNAEVRNLREQNSHLILCEIRLREPQANERRPNARFSRNLTHYTPPLDPLPVVLDQLDFQVKYSAPDAMVSEQAIKFQLSHTVANYREQQKSELRTGHFW
jgi:hypothetical protein